MEKTSDSTGVSARLKKIVKEYSGQQKAAAFLVAIGSEISSEIFKYLREDD